jgi:hypothetical protein
MRRPRWATCCGWWRSRRRGRATPTQVGLLVVLCCLLCCAVPGVRCHAMDELAWLDSLP